jgi:hypothetical protein
VGADKDVSCGEVAAGSAGQGLGHVTRAPGGRLAHTSDSDEGLVT